MFGTTPVCWDNYGKVNTSTTWLSASQGYYLSAILSEAIHTYMSLSMFTNYTNITTVCIMYIPCYVCMYCVCLPHVCYAHHDTCMISSAMFLIVSNPLLYNHCKHFVTESDFSPDVHITASVLLNATSPTFEASRPHYVAQTD